MQKLLLCLLFTLALNCPGVAQSVYLQGSVSNSETGQAIPFVTIYSKLHHKRTVSNSEGKFVVEVESSLADTLVFSSVGYKSLTMAVSKLLHSGTSPLSIKLREDEVPIKEVTVYSMTAKEIMERAIRKAMADRSQTRTKAEGFYKRAVSENDAFVSLAEALVQVEEPSTLASQEIGVSYVKARVSNNYQKYKPDKEPDYLISALKLDHALFLRGFFNLDNLEIWNYELLGFSKLNHDDIYILQANLLDTRKRPTHQARVYINSSDFSILKIDYDYVWDTRNVNRDVFQEDSLVYKKYAWKGTFGYALSGDKRVLSYFLFATKLQVYTSDPFRRLTKVASQEIHEEFVSNKLTPVAKTSAKQSLKSYSDLGKSAFPYDEAFWNSLKMPEESQIFKKARMDLEKHSPLEEQFRVVSSETRLLPIPEN